MTLQNQPPLRAGPRSSARALHRTVSRLALFAGSIGWVALASPAQAECVEGPPNNFQCAGQTDNPQVIDSTDAAVTTVAGFGVDTTDNGNGRALDISGLGNISYTDGQASTLAGGGVRIVTTGSNLSEMGGITVLSNGRISADGDSGLRLRNASGETNALWAGSISNIGGTGVSVRHEFGTGDLGLIVNDVTGRDAGIDVTYLGNGSVILTANGPIVGQTYSGISIYAGTAADDVQVTTGDVIGGTFGIDVSNDGTDFARVVSTGTVTGLGEAGIYVGGSGGTTGIEVFANKVTGRTYGIQTEHLGTGTINIIAQGTVAGTAASGISVSQDVQGSHISIQATDVSGHDGIFADNDGIGMTRIISTGSVVGFNTNGITVENASTALGVVVDVRDVEGAETGIEIENFGTGDTLVRSTGTVTGVNNRGIEIQTGTAGHDVIVDIVALSGGADGLFIAHQGSGKTDVTASGVVTATGTGISVINGIATTDVSVQAATVQGTTRGITTENNGSGRTFIRATGPVSGAEFGILAENGSTSTGLTIRADDVQSLGNGITAANQGTGGTEITSSGTVVARDQVGIRAFAGATAAAIQVEALNASGGSSGISTVNFGLGQTNIIVNGVVEGGSRAIEAFSNAGQEVGILNNGMLRNASGKSADLAITATGGFVGVFNGGDILGTVDVSADLGLLSNLGRWNSIGGTSHFIGADDRLINGNLATVIGATSAGLQEITTWTGLESFETSGLLRLQDGGMGDVIRTSANSQFSAESVLSVDIGGTTSDLFQTTGTLSIKPGAHLTVNMAQPVVLHTKYVVAQADGGLTGTFDFQDKFLTAFAGLRDGYTAKTAFVEFAQLRALADAGLTPNQKAGAAGADSLPNGNKVKDALLLLPSDALAQKAFDQLSGEVHPSTRMAAAEASRLPRNAVLDRLSDGEAGGAVWGRAFGNWGLSDGDTNAASVDRNTKGLMLGVDGGLGESVTIGVAGAWLDTDVRIAARNSSGSVESLYGLAYAGARFGGFGLRGGVGYARTTTKTQRTIGFPGFSDAVSADYHGSILQGFVEAGYRVPLGGGHVEPFASLTVLQAKSDAFAETGGPAALSGQAIKEDVTASTVGLRFETSPAGALSLRGSTGWRHGWGDLDPVGLHNFGGGTPFAILGAAQSKNAGIANVEARWRLSSNVTLGVAYDGVLGTGGQDHAITGGLKVSF